MAQPVPDISVIVPTFDRERSLTECLRALAKQTLEPSRFEVIVCDDGSPVPAAAAVARVVGSFDRRITVEVVRQDNLGPAAARNRGAVEARGRFLAFTDDDCRPDPEWLERLLNRFRVQPSALLGGAMTTLASAGAGALATQAIMDFVYRAQESRGGLRLYSTSNLAMAADAFREIGAFSEDFTRTAGEDYDFCVRWQEAGWEAAYVPDAGIVHEHPVTLGAFWRQHLNYGRGLLFMRQRMGARGFDLLRTRRRTYGLPGTFHLHLIASPIRSAGIHGAATSALVALSQAATATGVLVEILSGASHRRIRTAKNTTASPK